MKYNIKTIYVAGGCFWEIEAYISRLKGVIQTEVGYANGITHDPTYAECVKVNYNTFETSLEEIIKEFLKIIQPSESPHHRLGIYWHDPKDAKSILRLVNKNPSIEAHELKGFYLAENKYLKYLERHPEINSNIKINMNQSDNLTLLSYQVTKLAMNEEAFSGKYADFDEEGTYVDITNNEEPDAITSLRDFSYGMVRLEIRAQKSGIHLGYKKRDYYEINSAALKFVYK